MGIQALESGRCGACGHTVSMHTGGTVTHYCEAGPCDCMGYDLLPFELRRPAHKRA